MFLLKKKANILEAGIGIWSFSKNNYYFYKSKFSEEVSKNYPSRWKPPLSKSGRKRFESYL
ncbi:MAG: hypothetical protein D8M61_05915 [Ignavibacteriae bacterium]|nr:hypothetical protein [Ignavibacteriota bacterium]